MYKVKRIGDNTCSYSYPNRMDVYFVCVLSILLRGGGGKSTKGCIPPPHSKSNDCIYNCFIIGQWKSIIRRCSPTYFICNSEIFKKIIIIYLYNEPF